MNYLFEPVPAKDVAAWIRQKIPLDRAQFDQLLPELKARAFVVSGIHAADALQDLRDTVARLPEGELFPTLQKELAAKLAQYTDADQPDLIDRTPEEKAEQEAKLMQKARFILRNHGNQAYAVAAHSDLEENADIFPNWKYLTVGDEHVRDTHKALNGLILPKTHEFWKTHFPPWEFACRCQVVPVTANEYEEYQQLDQGKPLSERMTLTDEEQQRLTDERKLVRRIGTQEVDLDFRAPSEKLSVEHPYIFNPSSLKLPLDALRSRYDDETWKTFQTWAKGCKLDDGKSVWQWLNKGLPKAKKAAAAAPSLIAGTFPAAITGLTMVRALGGSTGATLMQAADGTQYVMKRGSSAEHVRSEFMADEIYRSLGLDVPEARLYETDAGPVKLARYIEGTTLKQFNAKATAKQRADMYAKIQDGFAADALLGNWDVVGMDMDNILIDAGGKPWRIDNGGALNYRAQGSKKQGNEWNDYATELWSMRDAATHRQSGMVFGDMDIYRTARQIDKLQLDTSKLPADIRATLDARLKNMRAIGTKALDMEHDQWKAGYSDELTKHMMGLREAGIVARMPKKMTQAPKDVHVVDENGKPWDDLRATKSGTNTAPDPYFNDIVAAAKSINHHMATGTFLPNQAKIAAALKHKATLEAAQKFTGDPMAMTYLDHIAKIEAGVAAAANKTAAPIPALAAFGAAPTTTGNRSLVSDLADYITAQGGDYKAVSRWKLSQAGDSWNPDAQAYKAFLADKLDIDEAKIWWKHSKASADSDLTSLRAGLKGDADIAWTAHHAFVQELLVNTDIRYNDRERRVTRLVRTEESGIVKTYGIAKGAKGAEMRQRGLNESSSIFRPVAVFGSAANTTVQAVPHSRITGLYLMEREPGSGGTGFYGDGENEFTFITPGIAFDLRTAAKIDFDGESDATQWKLKTNVR